MPNTVMHCFDPDKAEAEGKLVGSLLAGYGELELEMANCLFYATEGFDNSIKKIFRIRGADKRITTADKDKRPIYEAARLIAVYDETMSDMSWCRKIRNQYAHCHWFYTDALYLVKLEEIAKATPPIGKLAEPKIRIDLPILQEQMDFFVQTRERFWYLGEQCQRYRHTLKSPEGQLPNPIFELLPAIPQPPLHL